MQIQQIQRILENLSQDFELSNKYIWYSVAFYLFWGMILYVLKTVNSEPKPQTWTINTWSEEATDYNEDSDSDCYPSEFESD